RTLAAGSVDDEERAVQRDLDTKRLVLDDPLLRRRDTGALCPPSRRRAERGTAHARRSSVERGDRVALPGHRAPHDRRLPGPSDLTLQTRRERLAIGPDAREARSHVDVMHSVDRTAADGVVRMVLEQRAPQRADLLARDPARQRVERLAALEEQPFAPGVLLFDPDARGIHPAEDRAIPAAHHLAHYLATRLGHLGLVLLEAPDARVDVPRCLVKRGDRFGQARVRVDVIDDVRREDAVARRSLPAELRADPFALVADATREDIRAVSEAAQDLRRLR